SAGAILAWLRVHQSRTLIDFVEATVEPLQHRRVRYLHQHNLADFDRVRIAGGRAHDAVGSYLNFRSVSRHADSCLQCRSVLRRKQPDVAYSDCPSTPEQRLAGRTHHLDEAITLDRHIETVAG